MFSKKIFESFLLQFRKEKPGKLKGYIRIGTAIVLCPFETDFVEGDLLHAGSHHLFIIGHGAVQMLHGHVSEAMGVLGGIEQVRGNHGIAVNSPEMDAKTLQDNPLILDVVSDLSRTAVLQQRFQLIQNPRAGKLPCAVQKLMGDRNIECLKRSVGEADSDQIGPHG